MHRSLCSNLIALAASTFAGACYAEPPALSDLFSDPSFKEAKISPDGNYIGVVVPNDEKDILAIIDRNKNKGIGTLGFGGARESVANFNWIKGNKLIFQLHVVNAWNEQPIWNGELFAANFDGTGMRSIYGYRAGEQQVGTRIKKAESTFGSGFLLSELPDDPENVLITSVPWSASGDATTEVLSVNLRSGRARKVIGSPIGDARFFASINGQIRFAVTTDRDAIQQVYSYEPDAKTWQKMASNTGGEDVMQPLSLSADGNTAYYLSDRGASTRGLFSYTFSTGESQLLYRHDKYNVEGIEIDPISRLPIWAVHEHDHSVHYLTNDNPWVQVHKRVANSFPGSRLEFTSYTNDYKKVMVFVHSDRDPGVWYSVDMDTRKAKEELIANPKIDPEAMLPMQRISLTARDGLLLNGFYTAPKPQGDQKPPMVLFVHGGPHAQDDWGFNAEVQALATRGYAVLQVNFRGSTGYGNDFEMAGRGQWGRAMQDDLTDATKWAIAQGLADANRICIMGASYGGYATLMGLIREPDLYRCGVDMLGVTDLETLATDSRTADARWGKAYLEDLIGNDPKEWHARSPAKLAAKIQDPVLIIAGEEDEIVSFEHSEMMEEALKKAGKPVETLYFSKEAHGFFNPKNRVKAYEHILSFLDKHIGAKSVAP